MLNPAGEFSFSDNLDIDQLNTFILGLQLKFGISKRNLLKQRIHLKIGNILFLFYFLLIPTFAFKYEFRKLIPRLFKIIAFVDVFYFSIDP